MDTTSHLLVVTDDLFFSAKIGETARQVGVSAVFVSDGDELDARIQQAAPALIMVDLGLMKADSISLIERLKQHPLTRTIPVIAYGSHVDHDLMARAARAGCDQVLPRSAFSQRLPGLLRAALG